MSNHTRAILYLRQSTYREESISLEVQEATCRAYAARLGYEVVGVESDPGISGRTWQRRGVQAVMDAVESGRADVVVLWRWSRLSRSRKDWALAADRADLAGARIESATEPNDASAAGRFARGVMTELAAFESERIGEAWKEAHARRTAAGLPANGKPRFGYLYDTANKIHKPDPFTGPVLEHLYRRYVAGDSVYALTRWMNTTGHQPAAGYGVQNGVWSERTLRRMLDTGFGAGIITVRGERRPGAHDPVINEGLWAQYLDARISRARPSGQGRREYTLTGLCWCDCGSRMACEMDGGGRPRLRCRASKSSGAHRGGYANHDLVLAEVLEHVGALGRVGAVGEMVSFAGAPARDFDQESKAASEQLIAATRQHLSGVIPESAYLVVRDELTAQISALEAERIEAAAVASRPKSSVQARTLLEDWQGLAIAQRREALRLLIERVNITPGRPRSKVQVIMRSL